MIEHHEKGRYRLGTKAEAESDEALTGNLPAYPDLQGHYNAHFTGVQGVFYPIRPLSGFTRCTHGFYSVNQQYKNQHCEPLLGAS